MAKIRKYKLSWQASDSDTVVSYKIYWSKNAEVRYHSKGIDVGKVTEIVLPDRFSLSGGPIMFGVAAVDKDGNESDIVTLAEPYQPHIPKPPVGLSINPTEKSKVLDTRKATESIKGEINADPLADAIESHEDKKLL